MKTFHFNYMAAGQANISRRLILLTAALAIGGAPLLAQAQIMMPNPPPGITAPRESGPPAPPGGSPGTKSSSGGPWVPSAPLADYVGGTNLNGSIQLSFQGANVDMVAQWLAQTTGKAVIKHPQVQCQVTIMSSQKVPAREAINMIYRALALQGYSAVELSDSILIVPQGQEPKMSPEVVTGSMTNVPAGWQLLVKVFQLKHAQAAQVKERIQSVLSDKATVDVDENGNRIIVTDYNDNLRVVGDLIDALDREHPQDVTVRVIPLKHIAADQVAREIEPLYDKMTGKAGNKTAVDVVADDRSNSLIVFSDVTDFGAIEKLVAMLDTEEAQEKETRTFILTNADAADVAQQLEDLNQSETTTSRYAYYFGSSPPSNPKKLSVVADHRRNAVIVQAPPAQMDSLAKMIAELDQPISDDSLAPEIYPLKYVSATDIEDVLNELFLKKTQQRTYWDVFFGDSDSDNTGNQNVGRLYGKVRITSEPYSNAIIITSNSKENLAVIENVLKQLDQPSQAGESTLRIGLKFANADTVAKSLNILFAKNGSPALNPAAQQNQNNNNNNNQAQSQQQQSATSLYDFDLTQESKEQGYYSWLGGQPDSTTLPTDRSSSRIISDLVGRVRCVADQRGNAVLISANVHFFPKILQLIQDLDAPSDKVTIEARIVQVSSDYLDKLGVRWSPNGSQVFSGEDYDNSLLASGSGNYQQGYGGQTVVNTPASSGSGSSVGSVVQTLASLRSGVVSSTLNIDYLVQFLREKTDATVLGEPTITINDNEMGRLFVGQQVPVPENTLVSSVGSQSTAITYRGVGVVLEVTPHINSDGDVQLTIHAESSTVDTSGPVLGGDVFDTDYFHTEVTAKNRQTLLLGGIIQKQLSQVVRKVPLLGSIPGIEWAFKKKDKTTQEVELMVFLRPTVLHNANDARELEQELKRKAPLLEQWQEESPPGTADKPSK
jgi:type II secretion system protein D